MFEEPRSVTDKSICSFYHTMTLNNGEHIQGKWELDYDKYLGVVDFEGKRALDIGTASGALTWEMERRGANVVGYDLSTTDSWDVIPSKDSIYLEELARYRQGMTTIHNGWWYCYGKNRSAASVVYGDAYAIPLEIGPVDIAVYGSVLLHLRDPFLALMRGLRLTRETVIVAERLPALPARQLAKPYALFIPDPQGRSSPGTWWNLTPEAVIRMVGILGFEDARVSYHRQKHLSGKIRYYTVVARRTREFDPDRGY